MKNKITEILKNIGSNSMSVTDLTKKTGFDRNAVESTLRELMDEKIITCSNSKYEMYRISPFREGTFISTKKGYGFVELSIDEEDIYISEKETNGSLNGDKVLIKIMAETNELGKQEGKVKKIIERKEQIAEIISDKKGRYYQIDKNTYIKSDIPSKIVDGTIVKIAIEPEKTKGMYPIRVIEELGHKNDPGMDIKKILFENNFDDQFPEEVMLEVAKLPSEVSAEECKGRFDLRNEIIFTIDGDDTKDIDDAVSLKILPNGNYMYTCHIADVSNYVQEKTAIDKEAYKRGTSVYVADRVSPMLPRELSNGICSLNEGVDRLTLSFFIEVTPDGKTVDFQVKEAIINSKIKMTYNKVNDLLDNNNYDESYAPYKEMLQNMKTFTDILFKNRVKEGSLEFDIDEIKVIVDDEGNAIDFTRRHQGTGENIIEELMILTNKEMAIYMQNLGVNTLYRVHERPDEEKINEVVSMLKNYGYDIKEKVSTNPKFIQYLLNEIKEEESAQVLSSYILRCMKKAKYDVVNLGHFGIAVDEIHNQAYMHTTSPIRRYPDLIFHRRIKDVLHGDFDRITTEKDQMVLKEQAIYTSRKERDAQECERQVNKMKMAEYFENLIINGQNIEDYSGMVSGLTQNAMFVVLKNLVEGRVSYSSMDDFYEYVPEFQMAVGKSNKKIYRLGDKVEVKVTRASKDDREIDFELVKTRKKDDSNGNSK